MTSFYCLMEHYDSVSFHGMIRKFRIVPWNDRESLRMMPAQSRLMFTYCFLQINEKVFVFVKKLRVRFRFMLC